MSAGHIRTVEKVVVYAGAAAVSFGLTYWILCLWQVDWRIPFAYGERDESVVGLWVKWAMESPWMLYNSHLGMPFRSEMFNIPQPDVFLYLVFKLLGLTTGHFGLVMNLYYLLTFPATFLCALYVFRRFKIGYPAALLGSFLYAFLPYHFMRGESHLFLVGYYLVPLVVLLVFRVASDHPPFLLQGEGRWPRLAWRQSGTIGAGAICVLTGASGVYYAFFACCLFLIIGMAVTAALRRFAPLVSALLLSGLMAGTILLTLLPHLLYGHGNPTARVSSDAETYALKVSQLLLPVSGHRLPFLAALKDAYSQAAPLTNENDMATLGAVGAFGFVLLICWAALRLMGARLEWLGKEDQRLINVATLATLASILLATVGGFGSLFATLVSPQIRSYNRISVYVSFFTLFFVAFLLDRAIGARLRRRSHKVIYALGLSLLTALGIYDQTTPAFIPDYATVRSAFLSDRQFVRAIEKRMPSGAMILQLPYMTFPEANRYDLARGYLHSRTLRWSYGAMINGRSDLWQRTLLSQPEPLRKIVEAGFSGIYLDRTLLPNNGAPIEEALRAALGEPSLLSADSRLSFFSLEDYKTRLESSN